MDIKQIELVTEVCSKIKKLDSEITAIDDIAMLIANNEVKLSFKLKVDDFTKRKEDDEKISFDADGSIVRKKDSDSTHQRFGISAFPSMFAKYMTEESSKVKDENVKILKQELSAISTMNILGIILSEKQNRRSKLINTLNKLGVKF